MRKGNNNTRDERRGKAPRFFCFLLSPPFSPPALDGTLLFPPATHPPIHPLRAQQHTLTAHNFFCLARAAPAPASAAVTAAAAA